MRFFAGTFTESNHIDMKKIVLYFILSLSALVISVKAICQNGFTGKRTFYIVRHAEKDTAGGNNPAISVTGKERAGDLFRALKKKKIDLIFISQYKRTGMTADSLRIYQHIDTVHYAADLTGDKLFEQINLRAGKAKNILVVGHSNTLPGIIRKAGVLSYTVKEIPDGEYDNLFVVTQNKGKATMKQKKFGKPVK
jgi:2,3-bisphosphoglycerate-dependent phosphoglycerate mutase